MTPPDPHGHDEAEALFAAWATAADDGGPTSIDELVAAHPSHADALRRLHEDWKLFAPLLGRAVPGVLRGESGIALAPLSSAGEDGDDREAPSQELLDRLGIQTPERGRYKFRSVIGQGGGGVVLKVWDSKLSRPLAMKVVLGRGEARPAGDTPPVDGRTLSRFVDEARIASQLNHPGIVPVHELGADETGRAYFTMKLVRGEDLSTVFRHVRTGTDGWNMTRAVGVLLRVCESLAFAHEKGVVHRDLKPANVMVGRHGEVYVMDWGLARVLGEPDPRDLRPRPTAAASTVGSLRYMGPRDDASPLLTMDGDVIGTPVYMSPEQARGELAAVGPRSDVYGVGAMLYELIVGEMPYVTPGERPSPQAVWNRVLAGPPPSLTTTARRAPVELIAICERAMARDADQRYPDMRTLADDLRAFLERRVVAAYESGTWAETRMWVRRHRALAATLVLLLLTALAGAVAVKIQTERALISAIALEQERSRAALGDQAIAHSEWMEYIGIIRAADVALRGGAAIPASRFLERAPERLRGWEWKYLHAQLDDSEFVLTGHDGPVLDCDYSPDGLWIATVGEDGTARIWDAKDGARLAVFAGHGGSLRACKFSPDSRHVAVGSDDGVVRLWSISDRAEVLRMDAHEKAVVSCAFHPDGSVLWTLSLDGTCKAWRIANGSLVQTLDVSPEPRRIRCYDDGTVAVVSTRQVQLWSADGEGRGVYGHVWAIGAEKSGISADAFPLGRVVSMTNPVGTAQLWTNGADQTFQSAVDGLETSRVIAPWVITDAALHGSGRRTLLATQRARYISETSEILRDAVLRLWDLETVEVIDEWRGHRDRFTAVAIRADGRRAVSSSYDGTARVWGIAERRSHRQMAGFRHGATSPDGSLLAANPTGEMHGLVSLCDWRRGRAIASLQADSPAYHGYSAVGIRFGDDGRRLVTSHLDEEDRVWDLATGIRVGQSRMALRRTSDLRRSARWSGQHGVAEIWDEDDSILLAEVPYDSSTVGVEAVWSSDSSTGAFPVEPNSVHIIDAADGKVRAVVHCDEPLSSIALDGNGSRLAVGDSHGGVHVWDTYTDELLLSIPAAGEFFMWMCAFSPDGRFLARTPSDNTVRIYDFSTARDVVVESYHAGFGPAVFSPDSQRLAIVADAPQIVDPATGSVLLLLPGTDQSTILGFSIDGSRLFIADGDVIVAHDTEPSRVRRHERRTALAAAPIGERAMRAAIDRTGDLVAAGEWLRGDGRLGPNERWAALDALLDHAQECRRAAEVLASAESRRLWIRRVLGEEPWPEGTAAQDFLQRHPHPTFHRAALAWFVANPDRPRHEEAEAVFQLLSMEPSVVEDAAARATLHEAAGWADYWLGRFDEALERLRAADPLEEAERGRWQRLEEAIAEVLDENGELRVDWLRAELEELGRRIPELAADPRARMWMETQRRHE